MSRTTFPRMALTGALQWLRLPVSGLELATGQRGNPTWPPALAFGEFEAGVKQLVGSILRDDGLVEEGRVRQTEVAELRRAVGRKVQADQQRADAHRELEEDRAKAAIEPRAAQTKADTSDRAAAEAAAALDTKEAERKAKRATTMATNSTTSRHVVPHPGGGWDVKAPNAKRASSHHDTQKQAERRAKEIVRNLGGGEVRIHGEDGRIRDSDTVSPAKDP